MRPSLFWSRVKASSKGVDGVPMPRKPRILIDGTAVHIVQRGVDRAATFFTAEDYLLYLELLREVSELFDLSVHAYCLMTNHIHLLLAPAQADDLSPAMKRLTQIYVQRINRLYGRCGPLWSGRYKTALVGTDRYLLSCYRYIELNPVRAKMVSDPSHYPWSSYKFNAGLCPSGLVTPHEAFLRLGSDSAGRAQAYQALFQEKLPQEVVKHIRDTTRQGLPMGDSSFISQIEQMVGRRLALRSVGRQPRIDMLRQK